MMQYRFNTSHVVVYPELIHNKEFRMGCFNTSHVVVYPTIFDKVLDTTLRFNTSHVVVYQIADLFDKTESLFQYISCCSLSCHPI